MQNVKKYIDEMFCGLPNSKRARELKSEMLSNIEERYQELLVQNSDVSMVEKQLITEIGTCEEIRGNINLNDSKKQILVVCIELLIVVLAFGFSRYVKSNEWELVMKYNVMPRYIAGVISNPIAVFFTTVLILTLINYIIRPQNLFVSNKRLRNIFLIVSIILMALYLLMVSSTLGIILIPFIPWKFFYFISKNINIIAGVVGVLLYLRIKK